jgi:hypothetical protein
MALVVKCELDLRYIFLQKDFSKLKFGFQQTETKPGQNLIKLSLQFLEVNRYTRIDCIKM